MEEDKSEERDEGRRSVEEVEGKKRKGGEGQNDGKMRKGRREAEE